MPGLSAATRDGKLSTTGRWTAILTIAVQPRDAERLKANPLGIYVNAISSAGRGNEPMIGSTIRKSKPAIAALMLLSATARLRHQQAAGDQLRRVPLPAVSAVTTIRS